MIRQRVPGWLLGPMTIAYISTLSTATREFGIDAPPIRAPRYDCVDEAAGRGNVGPPGCDEGCVGGWVGHDGTMAEAAHMFEREWR